MAEYVLCHAAKKQKHKYLVKVGSGKNARYLYTLAEVAAYRKGQTSSGSKSNTTKSDSGSPIRSTVSNLGSAAKSGLPSPSQRTGSNLGSAVKSGLPAGSDVAELEKAIKGSKNPDKARQAFINTLKKKDAKRASALEQHYGEQKIKEVYDSVMGAGAYQKRQEGLRLAAEDREKRQRHQEEVFKRTAEKKKAQAEFYSKWLGTTPKKKKRQGIVGGIVNLFD